MSRESNTLTKKKSCDKLIDYFCSENKIKRENNFVNLKRGKTIGSLLI
jgi:hypothetical protein